MRKLLFVTITMVLFGLALVWMMSAEGVLAAPNDPPARWESTLIESGLGTGQYASIAIHPTTGKPWVSYWYSPTNELHLAQYVGADGNCANGAWSCEAVATGILPPKTVITGGMYSSLAFTPDGRPAIAFYGGPFGLTIRYAEWSCPLLCSWTVKDIDYGSLFGGLADLSLKIGSDGVPRIAAYIPGYDAGILGKSYGKLKYFYRRSDNAGTGCASGVTDWQCDTIETRTNYGKGDSVFASLALITTPKFPSGTYIEPHIAYYDDDTHALKHAYAPWLAINGNCGPSNKWICETVSSAAYEGLYPVMVTDQSQSSERRWQIAYYDKNNKALKFAYNVSADGNCGAGSAAGKWQCDTIEGNVGDGTANIGDMEGNRVFSVATYNGTTAIAYYDNNDATLFHNGMLKWARSGYGVLDDGNCGPTKTIGVPPYMIAYKTWKCEVLDSGLYFSGGFFVARDVGQYPALAYDANGLAQIAYYDAKSGLRFMAQRIPVFLPLTLKNH